MAQQQEQKTGDNAYHLKTILLVEDDINIGEVLVQAITQETSYLAVLAADGFEALKVRRKPYTQPVYSGLSAPTHEWYRAV